MTYDTVLQPNPAQTYVIMSMSALQVTNNQNKLEAKDFTQATMDCFCCCHAVRKHTVNMKISQTCCEAYSELQKIIELCMFLCCVEDRSCWCVLRIIWLSLTSAAQRTQGFLKQQIWCWGHVGTCKSSLFKDPLYLPISSANNL